MPYIKLDSPGDGWSVWLSEAVVRGLRQLAIEGLVALPRRGMEVGGVLVGVDGAGEMRLDGFEEVVCEHRYGPSYALSETDKLALHELLAGWPADKAPVVGFFRSFTSREPVIEQADETFVREHFPTGRFVYLMVQPLSVENCVASFRFFRDGNLLPETEEPAFRFAAPEPVRVPLPIESAPASLPPAIAPRGADVEPDGAPRHGVRWWVTALLCLVSVAAGVVIGQLTKAVREPAPGPRRMDLHLEARAAGDRLEVSWDADQRATRGRLEVLDGTSNRVVELNAEEVRGGRLSYQPSSNDIRLRLNLYAKDSQIAGDTIRLKTIPELTIGEVKKPSPASATAEPPVVAAAPAEVYEEQPQIPEGIRSRIVGSVVIPVQVRVNDRGRVVRAVAEKSESGDSVRRYLADQAEKAALKWRFRPAQSASGERVAANKTLRFVFTR